MEDILSQISCSAQIVNLYRKTLEKLFEKDDYIRRDEIQRTRKEQERLEIRRANLQNDLMDRVITPQDHQDMKRRVEKDLVLIKDNLADLQKQTSPFRNYIQNEAPMLESLLEYYRKSDGATKKKLLRTIFAEKLIVVNGEVTGYHFTEPIKLMLRIRKSISYSKEKKKSILILNSCNLTRAKINPYLRHAYIWVLESIQQLLYSCISNVSNLIKASQKQLLEVWEVFSANSIKDGTKEDKWLQLCQKFQF